MFNEETYYWVYISGSDYPWISSDNMEALAGEDVDEALNNGLQPWLGSDILKAQDSGELVGAILYDYESHEELGTVEQLQNQEQNLYSGKIVKSASPIGKVHDLYKINQVTAEGAIEALIGMGYKRPQAKSIVEGWGETVKSSANRTEASFDKTLLSELTAWLPTDEKNDLLDYVKKNHDIPEEFNWEETRESLGDEKFYEEITAAMTMDRFQEFQDDYDRLFSSKSLKDLVGTTVTCTKGYSHPNMGKLFNKGKTYTVSEKDGRVYVGGILISDEFFNEHFITSSSEKVEDSKYNPYFWRKPGTTYYAGQFVDNKTPWVVEKDYLYTGEINILGAFATEEEAKKFEATLEKPIQKPDAPWPEFTYTVCNVRDGEDSDDLHAESLVSTRKVTVEFSDDSQAEPFKQEMKKRFNYPENVSKHQVVFGKDENGKPVFVGNSRAPDEPPFIKGKGYAGTDLGYDKSGYANIRLYQGEYYFFLDNICKGHTSNLNTVRAWADKFGVILDEGEIGEHQNGLREMYSANLKEARELGII